jgi:predicted dehydrogenase
MDVNKSKIGVGVVGLGVGEQHARAYLRTGQCELRWVLDLDAQKARAVVDRLGTGRVAVSLEEILDDPGVQAVSIASYDDAHFEQVVSALEFGKHVFVEKPLCRTMEELEIIVGAWSKHEGRVKLSSNLILRAASIYQWLKRGISSGEFGDVYAFDGDYLYGRLHKITDDWRKNVEDYSVMLGGGIHLVDLLLWLTGERPSSVYVTGNRMCTKKTEFCYNDFASATFHFPSGLIGRITANFGCVHRHQHVVRVFGTKKTFIYDDMGPRLHVTRDPGIVACPVTLPTLPENKGDLIPPFVSAILDDDNLNEHTQKIFDVITICAACDKAVRSGSEVKIHYV